MRQISTNQPKLTKRQQAFIDALITTGGHLKAAALIIGYPERTAKDRGSAIWRSERVRAAYKEALWDKLGRGAGSAVNTLVELAEKGPAKVRREAADSILDRLGFKEAAQTAHAGITINIGLRGDQPATKPIDVTPQPTDVHTAITVGTSDDTSEQP